MDEQLAITALMNWTTSAEEIVLRNDGDAQYIAYSDQVRVILEQEDQVGRIVQRVLETEGPPELTQRAASFYSVSAGLQLVAQALGRLRTGAQTQALLGPSAPTMAADALHAVVWDAAGRLWSDGHYGQAVQRAATFVNAEIQERVGRHDVSDAKLMQEAFSSADPGPNKARLRWPGSAEDLTVTSMREGIRGYAVGCYQAIRNPATHTGAELVRQVALEHLAALSVLMRWVDGCERLEAR